MMSPITAAKHAGLDWSKLSPREQAIVARVTRALNRYHDQRVSELPLTLWEAGGDKEIVAELKGDDVKDAS